MNVNYLIHVHALLQWIEDHLSEELTIELLSQKSGYSSSYLQKIFKDTTGDSLSKYVRGRRMFKAGVFLCFTRASVGYISEVLRFNSISAFSRSFKNNFGVSPQDFRRKGVLNVSNTIAKAEVFKIPCEIKTISMIDNASIRLYGQYFNYSVDAIDFDKPHFNQRKRFRKKFFQHLGYTPEHYYATSQYSPSWRSEREIDIKYFVGLAEQPDGIAGLENAEFCLHSNKIACFYAEGIFVNPFYIALSANMQSMSELFTGWNCNWDLECFLTHNRFTEYRYIIPVS
ncbi:helix-turn-helix domain-containing protein [Citrobacter koseri]|uniref:helix-turn-helix domain-containing protein n=1 Tax=Citrobacter koseri TaxID=545 RepID=UPI001DDE8D1F|nr:AraC family transcriptional regulator [Citrobacter koseri]CAG0222267.1 Right origin-binding protein [Citrobacter koseri]CAH5972966.1 Right origin-binding protein [Citrobacter koseri]